MCKQTIFNERYKIFNKLIQLFLFVLLVFAICQIVSSKEDRVQNACGPRSLKILCDLIGVKTDIKEIYRLSRTDESGTTMYDLADAAHALGLNAVGMKIGFEDLVSIKQPVIAFVQGDHFLVIERLLGKDLRLIDPSRGIYIISQSEFNKVWNGHILLVNKKETEKPQGKQPDIEFDRIFEDIGTVEQRETIVRKFSFKNVGNAPLIISKAGGSCQCVISLLGKKKLLPGEKGFIEVKFETKLRRGEIMRHIMVRSNDPYEPVVYLTLKGIIAGTVVVVPNSLYIETNGKETILRKVKILDPGEGKLKIKKANSTSPYIHVKIMPRKVKEEIKALVTVNPGIPIGEINEKITFLTNLLKSSQVTMAVTGVVHGEISIFPKRFFYGLLNLGEQACREVTISKEGESNLSITKVEVSSELIKYQVVTIEKGREYVIRATLNPKDSGILKEKIKVYTNNKRQPFFEIPLYASIQ